VCYVWLFRKKPSAYDVFLAWSIGFGIVKSSGV
jgi:hypothetical protein